LKEAFEKDTVPKLYPGLEYVFMESGVDPYIAWNIGKDESSRWQFRFYVDEHIEEEFIITAIEFWYDGYDEKSYKPIDVKGEDYQLLISCFRILQYGIIINPDSL
jgi:hypothetical protein